MSEMVERVATEIETRGEKVGAFDYNISKAKLIVLARAAIDAMRPSEDFVWDAVYNLRPMLNCVRGHDLTADEAHRIFNAVIEAALEEKQ